MTDANAQAPESPNQDLQDQIEDLKAALHKEERRHQETKWKYGDAVNEARRWKKAYVALVRAEFPEREDHETKDGQP